MTQRAARLSTRSRALALLGAGALVVPLLLGNGASAASRTASASQATASTAPYVPGELVVGFDPQSTAKARAADVRAAGAESEAEAPGE